MVCTSRPARPARCIADDLVMSRVSRVSKPEFRMNDKEVHTKRISPQPVSFDMYLFSLHFPVSITYLIPGIVIDVSAIFVANIHFLVSGGVEENIRACWEGGNDAYIGHTATWVGI